MRPVRIMTSAVLQSRLLDTVLLLVELRLKALSSFSCPSSLRDVLSMSFKPSSKKVASAALDLTIQSELIKKGKAG